MLLMMLSMSLSLSLIVEFDCDAADDAVAGR
jgi:hypothetical protein